MKKIIDLTHTLNSEAPFFDGGCGFEMSVACDYKDCTAPNTFRTQKINCGAGVGTHMDSPAHCVEGALTVDLLPLDTLVSDCVVVKHETEDANFIFTKEYIENFENKNGKIKEGTFIIFHSSWSKKWQDKDAYRNELVFPSVSPDVATLLIERGVSGIGIDTLSSDSGGKDFPVHRIVLGAGKYLVENVCNADLLPEIGARIFVMPMKIEGATEAPIRLIAEF